MHRHKSKVAIIIDAETEVNLIRNVHGIIFAISAQILGCVDNSSLEALRPATCSRDLEILFNAQHDCAEVDRSGSREQVAGRRDLNCQQALV